MSPALQWGRAPRSAETSGVLTLGNRAQPLQWGRAPRSAETASAAIGLTCSSSLQWGRAPRSAETRRANEQDRALACASMGPRSEERGNVSPADSSIYSLPGFNGAALRGARKPALVAWLSLHPAGFNGAALRGARKLDRFDGDLTRSLASMGPRSEERGNDARAPACWADHRASMGPRSEERGNQRRERPWHVFTPASMGPRSEERGNLRFKSLAPSPGMLQWGRAPRSAETGTWALYLLSIIALQWGRAPRSAETRSG